MTVLIQEMSATVISAVNHWTIALADFTVLPKKGISKIALDKNLGLKEWVTDFAQRKAGERRAREGFRVQSPEDLALEHIRTTGNGNGTLDDQEAMASDVDPNDQAISTRPRTDCGGIRDKVDDDDGSDHNLARQLAQSIKAVAQDLRVDHRENTRLKNGFVSPG